MALTAGVHSAISQTVERRRPYLLIVSDGADRFDGLLSSLRREGVAVERVERIEDLRRLKLEKYALAILDLKPSQLLPVLLRLRARAALENLPVLVESSRLSDNNRMAALLRRFRAMPCALGDLVALVRKRFGKDQGRDQGRRRRKLL